MNSRINDPSRSWTEECRLSIHWAVFMNPEGVYGREGGVTQLEVCEAWIRLLAQAERVWKERRGGCVRLGKPS